METVPLQDTTSGTDESDSCHLLTPDIDGSMTFLPKHDIVSIEDETPNEQMPTIKDDIQLQSSPIIGDNYSPLLSDDTTSSTVSQMGSSSHRINGDRDPALPLLPSTNSLSKLFAEDKHGSDTLGKAFFDVLASTIPEMPAVADAASNLDFSIGADHKKRLVSSSYSTPADAGFQSAWIPKTATSRTLLAMASAPPGTYFPDKDDLTMPGVIMTEEMKDPIYDLVRQYLGEEAAIRRVTLTADSISQDEEGLIKLINVGCYRAAVNLTARLLATHGQGLRKAGRPSRNSAESLQIWLVRLSLLLKLRLFNMAEAESEPFADLDKPDLYYEFHPDVYGNRRGSIVPFALRTLLPQILSCVGKFGEALDRLYVILNTVNKIKENLLNDRTENGNEDDRSEATKQASLALWKRREIKVLYTITNCLVAHNDFLSAYTLLDTILERSHENVANVRSAQGRVLLQLGDIKSAQASFNLAASARRENSAADDEEGTAAAMAIDRAMMFIALNNFAEALNALKEAQRMDPNNPAIVNNMAVCLLYMGRLQESVQLLESAIAATPKPYLHECVVVNICTLYDLESSKSVQKKSSMLDAIGRHTGDGFNVFCLKLQSIP